MDEYIEEEMSQDMEKGFLALGITSIGIGVSIGFLSHVQWWNSQSYYSFLPRAHVIYSSLVVFTVKYTRDPSTFYAAKLQKCLQDGDTDTAGRVILTSTTVKIAKCIIFLQSSRTFFFSTEI